jgi:nicotinamidase-related amidase
MDFKIDRKSSGLVVIDIQKGIASIERKTEPFSTKQVIENVSRLVKKFREVGAPVFLVHVGSVDGKDMLNPLTEQKTSRGSSARPSEWFDFVDEIKPTEKDIIITKRQWGAFYGTELDLQLRRRKINTIVLCGISTNIGVETTAREAYQRGYNQFFAVDAMTAQSKEEHEATEKFIFPRIGVVRTTEQLLKIIN